MRLEKYLDRKYTPREDDLICLFRIEAASGLSIEEAACKVAAESSVGTWVENLKTETKKVKRRIERLHARVFEIRKNFVKIAYPIELFEPGNMPQIVSSVAGNIFGMKAVKNLRLEDLSWPRRLVKSFKGPQLGIPGIRKILKIWDRPLVATVPKPKVGMTSNEYSRVAYELWKNGIDFVKNDENLTSQNFSNFYKTTERVLKVKERVERECGDKKAYLPNVSSETKEMVRRARFVEELGGKLVMVDLLTVGWSSLQTLREECGDLKLGLYAHRAFHASFTRNPKHGMSMLCVANIARLIGVDALHIGGMGKLVSTKDETYKLKESLSKEALAEAEGLLAKNWWDKKPVFPVASGGLHPGIIPRVIELLGKDIILQVGGGVVGHKMGISAGAKAVRQAIDACLQGMPLEEYARTHEELRVAIESWGRKAPV